MKAKKNIRKDFSTCFETIPSGRKLANTDSKGVGSLCSEIISGILAENESASSLDCKALLKRMITMKEKNK